MTPATSRLRNIGTMMRDLIPSRRHVVPKSECFWAFCNWTPSPVLTARGRTADISRAVTRHAAPER